ncbi:endonuclease MutS2 [Fructilactobacillus ixorae]|uniref:Endonuclease MutS2 n=1 Tax=Fructilactobacillus ixorae TaxID=1750535 RepID=A0ABY5C4Q0_9LACO|nr:endonuclease MutS2 [Fructilactobacillus ixorae]USS93769.1 endonuclease MutS2 [Fructilactobacillus ixorae]
MNEKILQTLEYQRIKDQLAPLLVTEAGQAELQQLLPSSDQATVQRWLDETDDGAQLHRLNRLLPLPKLKSITPAVKRLGVGASLNGKELARISAVLRASARVQRFFAELEADHVHLNLLNQEAETFASLPDLATRLRQSIDENGFLKDDASATLRSIRRRILQLQGTIKGRMESYLHGKKAKDLSETVITIRDDRYVLPVKSEAKQKVGGIVHDQSATGQTLYVEPASVVGLNNDLRSEQSNEREESKRILRELSDLLRPKRSALQGNAQKLGHFDFINAKARYAAQTQATKPRLSVTNQVELKQARHPLINQDQVVGNDLTLGFTYRQIIITGPNTGGKTITMKTLGLLQLMAQSGLFVTANEGSQAGLFDEVFADIGDEQSIEQNLSTFSSHLDNIIQILNQTTKQSLVLIDELGAGTDPHEGAALAIAILDAIGAKQSEVLATTHYPELKVYGYNRPETTNASMEFDEATLQPTYRLLMGIPGQSNALSIAARLGLPANIVAEARSLTSQDSQEINRMIQQLTKQTKLADERARTLDHELTEATALHAELQTKFTQFTEQRDQLLNTAKRDANQLVARTKREANAVIADLHHKQKQGAAIKEHEIIADQGKLNALEQHPELKHNRVLKRQKARKQFHVGDDVLVKTYGQRGVLLKKVGNHDWEVELGILKMKVAEADLEKMEPEKPKAKPKATVRRTSSTGLSTTLDLRGVRYEDAMQRLDRYIDAALLAGYPSVTIIHGKGTGALRTGVTNYLKRNRQVASFGFSPANAGGDGSTVVKFK